MVNGLQLSGVSYAWLETVNMNTGEPMITNGKRCVYDKWVHTMLLLFVSAYYHLTRNHMHHIIELSCYEAVCKNVIFLDFSTLLVWWVTYLLRAFHEEMC